jgi:hypothetical protein
MEIETAGARIESAWGQDSRTLGLDVRVSSNVSGIQTNVVVDLELPG